MCATLSLIAIPRIFLSYQETSNPWKVAVQVFVSTLSVYILYRLCVKVLNDDKKLWEDEVYKFARKHQLEVGFVYLLFFF